MDAVIAAGSTPSSDDPLFDFTHGASKALLEIAGKPMIQWELDALQACRYIDRVVIIGLKDTDNLSYDGPMSFIPDHGGMLQNIIAGGQEVLRLDPNAEYVLSVSADIPGVTAPMIEWVIERYRETVHDFYYCVVAKKDMEARFPGCRRTYIRLRDTEVTGGDLAVIRTSMFSGETEIWDRLLDARKSVFKQASLIGFDVLFLLLMHRITIEEAARRVGKRLRIRARVLECPFPEVGMDVDKPIQLEMLRQHLSAPGGT
jgi:molybdopterin-guanine dinucleotide biosynthesis protein A